MANIFKKEEVNELYKYVIIDGTKYVIFTKFATISSESIDICVCDGFNVFTTKLTEDNLNEYVIDAQCTSKENFLSIIKLGTSPGGELSISENSENMLAIIFGTHPSSVSLTLYPTTGTQRKELFHYIFFDVAGKFETSQNELDGLKGKQVTEKEDSTEVDMFHYEPSTKRNKQVKIKSRYGNSLINPGTRKKKKATGVIYDDDI